MLDSDFDDPRFDPALPDAGERQMAMLAHLSALAGFVIPFGNIAGPLVMYLVKREESEFVADQAREALNFQITVTIAVMISAVLIFLLIGLVLLPIVGIAWLVLTIVAAVKANEGTRYRYPFTLRLVS
jgi:uncharacterized Tic20 family protein